MVVQIACRSPLGETASRIRNSLPGVQVATPLAEHHTHSFAPMFAERNKLPLDLRREIAQHSFVRRMNTQRRSSEQQLWLAQRNLRTFKVALALESREHPGTAGRSLPVFIQCPHADPVVERLQR